MTDDVEFFASPDAWEAVHNWHELSDEQQADSLRDLEAQLPQPEAITAYKSLIYTALGDTILSISAVSMEFHDRGRLVDEGLQRALQEHEPNEFFVRWWTSRVQTNTSKSLNLRQELRWAWDTWARRVLDVQDRVTSRAAIYLGKRGWDSDFVEQLDRYEFFAWGLAVATPSGTPIPPEPAEGHVVGIAGPSVVKQLSDSARSRDGWKVLDKEFLDNAAPEGVCVVGTLSHHPDRAECLVVTTARGPIAPMLFGHLDLHPQALRDLQGRQRTAEDLARPSPA